MSDTLQKGLETLATNQAQLCEALQKLAVPGSQDNRLQAPFARSGENALTSRGFQFCRIAGVLTKKLDRNMAKVEIDLCEKIKKEYVERGMYNKHEADSIVVPLSSELMGASGPEMEKVSQEVGEIVKAGVSGWDVGEARHIMKNYPVFNRTLSWLDADAMGSLVGPPVFGEPIELLRNQEVFMKAGATVVPFPPSGRIVWPRFTGSTTAYWLGSGENSRTLTESEPTTGDLVLQVKKLGVFVKVPNELFRFPSVSVEQVIRMDMSRTASLKMDKAFLEGTGSATEPKGITNYDNVNQYTAGTVDTDGNTLEPEDILRMIATVEEQNLSFGKWVMRPQMYAAIGNRRADSVTAGDKKGMFLFNVLRNGTQGTFDVTNNSAAALEGYQVLKSNQISNTREKGSASNLTYILGGQFEQYMIALSGVMEFMVTQVGDTPFSTDQSWIRLITWCDGAPRHEEAFVLVDDLVIQ